MSDSGDSIVFGGQVPRAATQVTGLTNLEKSKTLMTLSTAGVQTEARGMTGTTGHSKASPYVPKTDLFNFSNPDRPEDDLQVAQNQIYKDEPITPIASQPTFSQPTAARSPGRMHARYAQSMTFRGDGKDVLFGKFTHRSSCYALAYHDQLE